MRYLLPPGVVGPHPAGPEQKVMTVKNVHADGFGPFAPVSGGFSVRVAETLDFGQVIPDGGGHGARVQRALSSGRKRLQQLIPKPRKRALIDAVAASRAGKHDFPQPEAFGNFSIQPVADFG